jgi:DNA-binding SARP family transcriptional activator/DNA polymerase III delta prime subunit
MIEGAQPLQINLFGDFRLGDQDGGITGVRMRSQHLLAYLILHRHAPQPRRRIAVELWPEALDSQARTNLRKELHHLRQACPLVEQLLLTTPQTLHWQPQVPCDLDLDIFETALSAAEGSTGRSALQHLETALNAYQDDLWPDCDAEWIYPDQERLRQHHIRALAQATRLLKDLGENDRAITLGQQWLKKAPLDEGGYQTLMALYGEMGDRATALQLYHQCMTRLQTELGVSTSATTAEIYQGLLLAEATSEPPPAIPECTCDLPMPVPLAAPATTHPIVGREYLLGQLEQWLMSTGTSAPLLLLTGEPGIGKTRLLEALANSAIRHQIQPCWGRAFAAEQLRSYGVWIDLLRYSGGVALPTLPNLLPHFQHLPTDPQTSLSETPHQSPQDGLRHRSDLLDAVVQNLGVAATAEQPLLLLFDDVHWLDDASATLLHYVFRLLGQGPIRIACTARGQELLENPAVLNLVKALRRANRLQEMAVPPLSPEAVSALVEPLQTADPAHPPDPQQIYVSSGGNPLFALEAARAVNQTTSNLADLIGDRLQRLDPAARDLLPWAAALGHHFDPETLAMAAGYPPIQFLAAIEQLEAQQIVCPVSISQAEDAGHYNFVHDVIRQVAYDGLSQPRRRLIHGQLAKTLNAQAVDANLASQVAYHAGAAGDHALAAQAYTSAATRSLRLFAYADVVQLVAQGLHHGQFLPSRDRLLWSAQLLRSRVMAGVAPDAAAALERQLQQLLADMAGLTLAEAEVTAQDALNLLHFYQGNHGAVHEQTLKALDTLPPSPQLQAQSMAANGCCLAEIERDMDRAEAVLLEAQSLAERLGLSLSDIAIGLGCVERYRGSYDAALTNLKQGRQLAQNQQDVIVQGQALGHLAMTGWDCHQPDMAVANALLELSTQLPAGSEGSFAMALIALSVYAEATHPTEDAIETLDQALDQLNQLDAQRKLVFVASHASELDLGRDRPAAAQHYSAIAHQAAQRVGQPNDLVTASALQVLSAPTESDRQAHWQAFQDITLDGFVLNARAQALRNQATWAVQQPVSNPS